MILTVTPNPSLDRTYTTAAVTLGEVNRALVDMVEASGKGVNVSRVLHAAGVATVAVLTVGGAEGRQLRGLLRAEGLPHAPVPTRAPTRTNITVAEPGRTTKINSLGQALTVAEYEALVNLVAARARNARWVVISGSVPPDADIDLVPRLIAVARHAGARTAVDVSGPALEAASNAAPDLLAPNAAELAELSGGPQRDQDRDPGRDPVRDALRAAVEVSRRTGSSLLVSLGAAGALWVQAGKRVWHAVPPPVVPVNTVGAGDALLAGWLAGEAADDSSQTTHTTQVAQTTQAPRRLARAVAWGTAACLMSGTAGDVAAKADAADVTVTDITSTIDGW